jgi:hypothetical protein
MKTHFTQSYLKVKKYNEEFNELHDDLFTSDLEKTRRELQSTIDQIEKE